MKLAFSSNAFKKSSLEEALDVIAHVGYSGLEIMADIPHAYPPHMPHQRIADLKAKIDEYRMAVSNVNAFTLFALGDTYHPTWIESDPVKREQRIEHTANCIALAKDLGAKTISLQPGGPLVNMDTPAALQIYQQGLERLLDIAKQADVVLLVEPEPGLLIQTSGECVDFLKRVNHPNLKMNCDLGHCYCVGENPARVILDHSAWIGHVHLEDIAANRVHQHLIPGRGAMNFTEIFSALKNTGWHGWITVELYPYETTAQQAARESFDFLQKFI